MKKIILLIHVLILIGCANSSKEITSIESNPETNSIESTPTDKHICTCFFGNEQEYDFVFPDDCESKDSILILIPDTVSFHETGFQRKMFNLYGDILSSLKQQKFSGKALAYYDKDQKHLALGLIMLNGEMNGEMKAYSFEGEAMIERHFEKGELLSATEDIGNINWHHNKETNELEMDPSYFKDGKISIFFSSDVKHQSLIDRGIKPEEVFNKMKPLKVNNKIYSGTILYNGDKEGFTPLPIAKLSFSDGLLDGKTIFYGDYDDYPRSYDAWVINEEINYSKGVRSTATNTLEGTVIYKGSLFMDIDDEQVFNEFTLSFRLINDTVQETGRFALTQGYPSQYYITRGERRGDTLEIEMVVVSDARMSTVENAIASGERHKITFLISEYALKYIGEKGGCNYCASDLILKKYDLSESEVIHFLKPY